VRTRRSRWRRWLAGHPGGAPPPPGPRLGLGRCRRRTPPGSLCAAKVGGAAAAGAPGWPQLRAAQPPPVQAPRVCPALLRGPTRPCVGTPLWRCRCAAAADCLWRFLCRRCFCDERGRASWLPARPQAECHSPSLPGRASSRRPSRAGGGCAARWRQCRSRVPWQGCLQGMFASSGPLHWLSWAGRGYVFACVTTMRAAGLAGMCFLGGLPWLGGCLHPFGGEGRSAMGNLGLAPAAAIPVVVWSASGPPQSEAGLCIWGVLVPRHPSASSRSAGQACLRPLDGA
jgi:hypothetical protein